jgi:hypothetical protein
MAKVNWNSVLIFVALFAILWFLSTRKTSGYAELVTDTGDEIPSLFQLPVSLECTAGPGQKAAYYSTEHAGGICGDQEQVKAAMRNYQINEGIGGSLLEK